MKRKLSEEQLDNLMRSLANEATADEVMANDIADSPTLWWGVERRIGEQNEAGRTPWPPTPKLWLRLLFVGVPVATAVLIAITVFALRSSDGPVEKADILGSNVDIQADAVSSSLPNPLQPEHTALLALNDPEALVDRPTGVHRVALKKKSTVKKPIRQVAKRAEIKSEFIALSYAGNPESGQIVRIKVPSSMMVSLGLMANVSSPTSLVDAEVVIGDDGMSHAIRFIR